MANTYTIKNIDDQTGLVDVLFDCDGKTQKLAGVPLDSPESTTDHLDRYALAYAQGLEHENVSVDSDVEALVGKKQTPDTES